jgi:hypothetical protein
MNRKSDKYANFAEHPRYGRRPNVTGLNPSPHDRGVQLHWRATEHPELVAQYEAAFGKKWPHGSPSKDAKMIRRIPNTAIMADISRQTPATVAITHYFDLERECVDCHRPFIFFAEEQKHWYEELGFGLDSDCVRCCDCRKHEQGIARQREIYESLFHVPEKSTDQLLQMAAAALTLIEAEVFSKKQTERVRMLLNAVPQEDDTRNQPTYRRLQERVFAIENQ